MFQSRRGQVCTNSLKPTRQHASTKINASTYNIEEKSQKERKSKYNIPKNIRYDLENALVSLCDVWFEEIKPYLVSNNVKVHVHDNDLDVNCTMNKKTSDTKKQCAVFGAPNCSHLDPGAASDRYRQAGASFASSYSTRPVTSKMLLRKLPPPPPSPPSPLPRHPLSPPRPPPPSLRIPALHFLASPPKEDIKKSARGTEKKKRRRPHSPIREHLVPRLCRTNNITSDTMKVPKHY